METEAQEGEDHTAQDQHTLPAWVHPTVLDTGESLPQKVLMPGRQRCFGTGCLSLNA